MRPAATWVALLLATSAGQEDFVAPASIESTVFNETSIFNLSNCVLIGRTPEACDAFGLFNFSACMHDTALHMPVEAAPPLTPSSYCVNASGCLQLYDVPACVGPDGYNLTGRHGAFNLSVCLALFEAVNITLGSNATGGDCEALNVSAAFVNASNATDDGIKLEPLPRFHPCTDAYASERWQRLDFLARSAPYTTFMVAALSPDMGPVAGGTTTFVCGLGFALTNENVNHLKCRFSDGDYEVVVPAAYVDSRTLRCVSPDFSRFPVGLPHIVQVEVSLNRGGHWSRNEAPFTFFSTRPSIDAFGYPTWGCAPPEPSPLPPGRPPRSLLVGGLAFCSLADTLHPH